MRVFVAGATGAIGKRLVAQLVERGHEVIGTSRSAERAGKLDAQGAEGVVLDLLDAPAVRAAVLAARPDVIVHEATLDDSHHANAEEYGHSTSVEAAEVALKAKAKALFLTHISARYEDASLLEREAKAIFRNVRLAEDLMVVDVPLPS